MRFFSPCLYRVMESYDEYLSAEEYNDMIIGKHVIPTMRKLELGIRRQVKYPDSVGGNLLQYVLIKTMLNSNQLIAAYRQQEIEPTRNYGITLLFSL